MTTISPEKVSGPVIGKLYRLRWQIEIVIKRFKSLLRLDCLRAKKDGLLAMVYLKGKLLYACLIERRAEAICPDRTITWRSWQLAEEQIRPLITGVQHWARCLTRRAIVVLTKRPESESDNPSRLEAHAFSKNDRIRSMNSMLYLLNLAHMGLHP